MSPTGERPSARPQVRRGAQARPLRPGAAPLGRRRRVDRRERPVRRAGGAREARERAQHALPAQRPSSPPVPPQGAPGGSGRPSTPREAAGPPGAQPRPRLLEPAATEAARYPGLGPCTTRVLLGYLLTPLLTPRRAPLLRRVKRAQLLAIYDDEKQHKTLVRHERAPTLTSTRSLTLARTQTRRATTES